MTIGANRSSQAQLALMNTPGSAGGKPPLKARDILGQKSNTTSSASINGLSKVNQQKDMLRRHKKSLAIDFLLKT